MQDLGRTTQINPENSKQFYGVAACSLYCIALFGRGAVLEYYDSLMYVCILSSGRCLSLGAVRMVCQGVPRYVETSDGEVAPSTLPYFSLNLVSALM